MATIIFFPDIDEGHLYPTLSFANLIKKRGHDVYFLGIPDIKEIVESRGLNFFTVFEDVYPQGFIKEYKNAQKENKDSFIQLFRRPHLDLILSGQLDEIFDKLQPDLLIINYALPIETLIFQSRYCFKLLIFTSWLRNQWASPSVICNTIFNHLPESQKLRILKAIDPDSTMTAKLLNTLDSITEIIPCPREIDFPDADYSTSVVHIETGINPKKERSNFLNNLCVGTKKLIYASLGSQSMLYPHSKEFYQLMIDTMDSGFNSEWHLIMSVGPDFKMDEFIIKSDKISIFNWVPQVELLDKACIAIIHGGLGTIKECVLAKVPMILFPMDYDQNNNADRVQYHNLGIKMNTEINWAELKKTIESTCMNMSIKRDIQIMNEKFTKIEKKTPGIRYIESLIRKKR